MNKILYLSFCFFLILPLSSIAQSNINQKAIDAAKQICDCTKVSLSKNNIDVVKLAEIFKSYSKNNKLSSVNQTNIGKLNKQLDLNYSAIENDIYNCRSQFAEKYKLYLKNKEFLSKVEEIINNNPYTAGPKLIKSLAKKI